MTFSEKDIIYLIINNIIIKQLNKKLDYKYIGPYLVIKKILKNNYELNLLLRIKIYLIFYIFLLEDVTNINVIKIEQNNVEVKTDEYEIKKNLKRINKK